MSAHRATPVPTLFLTLALALPGAACGDSGEVPDAGTVSAAADSAPQVVDVTAVGHVQLELSTAQVPAGWTTFRFRNQTGVVHFALLERYPDGRGIEDFRSVVAPAFQNIMDGINGRDMSYPDAGTDLPEWFGQVELRGGPGLLAAGQEGSVTLDLEPGTYVIECYVKTADEVFHSVMGMAVELVVTDARSAAPRPTPTASVAISSQGGLEAPETMTAGSHTVAVEFGDQTAYEHFVGHDVHLVRLEDGTDLDAVAAWMDWSAPGGMAEPAPAEFLGGVQDLPAGGTGYMEVALEPGRYAWIAEVPDPVGKNMLRVFTVAEGDGR